MADKPYVIVKKTTVAKTFDDKKYKSTLPKLMKTAAEEAIANSGSNLTNKKSATPGAKTYGLEVTLTSLTLNSGTIEAKVSMVLTQDDELCGTVNGNAKIPNATAGDAEDAVSAAVKSVVVGQVAKGIQKWVSTH